MKHIEQVAEDNGSPVTHLGKPNRILIHTPVNKEIQDFLFERTDIEKTFSPDGIIVEPRNH